ncbi:MAG TPA: DUF4126 domain-containing protein [Thermoanaerobaculia bacterium]|nr:DUF4126 domain-containing protein [Thermoanaerobaculia bacterium]
MDTTTAVLAVLLGLGLSASTGLNTFIPLLILSGAARFNLWGVELGQKFDWLTSDAGLTVLIVAAIAEIIADKIPAVDHFLDSVGTFIRPAAATIASAAVLTGANVDPTVAAIVGFVVGTPTSLAFHTLKAGTRVASTATTFGCANPVLSIVEDVFSVGFSVLSIFVPLLVPFALALAAWLLWRTWKRTRGSAAPAGFVPPPR